MKILYLITKSEAGGAQTHVYQLCKYFRAHHNITVMAYPGGWLEDKCKELGVRFLPNKHFSNSMDPSRVMRGIKEVSHAVRDLSPDIVHCHSSAAGLFGRLAVRNNIPTIYTAHGWGFNIGVSSFQKWVAIAVENFLSRYTTRILCVSKFVRDLGVQYRIAPKKLFQIIYNGIEPQEKKASADLHHRITFVGRLARPKLPLLLLKSLQYLPKEVQEKIQVSIVGDGPQRKSVEQYIKEQNIPNVVLHGTLPREEIFVILHDSDIFVLLSEWEGLPITILEAMSIGLPVIASDVGGISEAVDASNGILISSEQPQEVADAIVTILEDSVKREQMKRASIQKVETTFSLTHMLEQIEHVYKEVRIS